MGELKHNTTAWDSYSGTQMSEYYRVDGRIGLGELIDQLSEMAPSAETLNDFQLNFATVKWTREATEEELAQRQRARDASDQRHREWEARHMRHLIEKYGEDTSQWPAVSSEDFAEYKAKNPNLYWLQ